MMIFSLFRYVKVFILGLASQFTMNLSYYFADVSMSIIHIDDDF